MKLFLERVHGSVPRLRRAASAVGLLVVVALGASVPAGAEICAVDNVPGATLLLPYFEVDLTDPAGVTTVFSVHNALDRSVLARVTTWTDLGVPTYAFDVYLTGYDVQSINLRDLFDPLLPVTGTGVSPVGPLSEIGGGFEQCDPEIENAPAPIATHLIPAHTGGASVLFGGQCAGRTFGDGVARGFVTVDVVTECLSGDRPLFPSEPGYFGDELGGDSVAGFDNALWGDYYVIRPGQDSAVGNNLVSLEADRGRFFSGDRTFYGRHTEWSGRDGREPLPGSWAVRTLSIDAVEASTRVQIWRDVAREPVPFACGVPPAAAFPGLAFFFVWDEEENPFDLRSLPITPPFTLSLGSASSDGSFAGFYEGGWASLDLNPSLVERGQAYASSTIRAEGRYSISTGGTALEQACDPQGCAFGREVEVTRLCVSSGRVPITELAVGEPVWVRAIAGGCFSGGCTSQLNGDCVLQPAGDGLFDLDARICVDDREVPCAPACDLSPSGSCSSPDGLAAGDYTVRAGDLELTFSVPSTVPEGGLCVGELVTEP